MRIRDNILILAFGAVLATGCAPKAHKPNDASLRSEDMPPAQTLDLKRIEAVADSLAQLYIATGFIPGMSVAVAKDGEIVFAQGYGKADVEMGTDINPETVYPIGSITKQFTAAIIMRLVEAGKISLDDPIIKYLPDYPVQGHHVTVHHLLNHTSGIKSFNMQEDDGRLFERALSYREMVDRFGKQPFDFKPGEKHVYNNFAYYLLGEIIGRATFDFKPREKNMYNNFVYYLLGGILGRTTGTPYEEYVERGLLQPLGLDRTMYCDDRQEGQNRAKGYEHKNGKHVNARYVNMRSVGAAGALCSTAGDLIRWTNLLHSGKVVSPESLRQMMTPTVLLSGDTIGYGYGLFLGDLDGHRKIFHGGRGAGFLGLVSHYPEDAVTITVLMNSETDREKRDQVEKALARAALGISVPDLPLTAADIARYEGTYNIQAGARTADLRVFGENGQLKAQIADGSITRLRYQGGHTFVHGENDDIRLIFAVENGRAQSVKVFMGQQVMPGERKP